MYRPVKKTLFIIVIVLVGVYGIAGLPASTSALMDNLHRNIRLGLDLRGGVSFILRVKVQDVPAEQRRDVVERTRRVLERRINPLGLSETPVQSYGSRGNELLVQLPDVRDTALIRRKAERCWSGMRFRAARTPPPRRPGYSMEVYFRWARSW
jgi:preprotein translocase subunit SecD